MYDDEQPGWFRRNIGTIIIVLLFAAAIYMAWSASESAGSGGPSLGGGSQVIQVSDPRYRAELESLRASEDEWRCLDRSRRARIERLLQEGG